MPRMFVTDLHEARKQRKANGCHGSYYNVRNANDIKLILDKLIEDPTKHARWNYADFKGLRIQCLKLKIYQGWNYLMDYMEEDDKYIKLRAECSVTQDREAIQIVRRHTLGQVVYVSEEAAAAKREQPWRQLLSEYLESDEQKLVLGGLLLSREDERFIANALNEVTRLTGQEFLSVVTANEIKLLKKVK